ncbi:tryptophan ABC transporter substrate-binding protein [Streptococcus hongkongensis]|nr:peptide ABC transporter substrate-binding protein [Streptococcus uberis]
MKNKNLMATLLILVIMVCSALLLEKPKGANQFLDKKVVRVGILQLLTHEALDQIEKGIEDELGKSNSSKVKIQIKLMNAQGDQSKIQTMSQQLAGGASDILVGIATPAAQGLAAATKDIPVVMSAISDPVGAKLVSNLKKPEGNVTGLSNRVPVKQTVDLIKQLTPTVKTIGILYASNEDNSISQVNDFKAIAQSKGYTVKTYAVPSTNEVSSTMSAMAGKVDALFIPQDNTIASAFATVVSSANAATLPIYSSVDTMVKDGSVASISQSQYQLGVETAKQVKELIAGKKVSQVPVTIVDTGKPVLNLKAAKALGISVPDDLKKESDILVKE